MWQIRAEEPGDALAIDALVERAFGPGRFAKSAYRLREGVEPEGGLGFVAVEDGVLGGSVRFWPVVIGAHAALLLGPLAVESGQRGRGMGVELMERGLDEARRRGHRAVVLVGDPPYYAKVGFAPLPRGRVRLPHAVDPTRVLGLALVEGGLDGLEGVMRRARIDHPVRADGAGLGAIAT
jgi:predicted N-acetyltransferase YhbS